MEGATQAIYVVSHRFSQECGYCEYTRLTCSRKRPQRYHTARPAAPELEPAFTPIAADPLPPHDAAHRQITDANSTSGAARVASLQPQAIATRSLQQHDRCDGIAGATTLSAAEAAEPLLPGFASRLGFVALPSAALRASNTWDRRDTQHGRAQ